MPTNDYKKTTVIFPIGVLRGLHVYIAKHDLTSHDQSKIVALALRRFLEADGIEVELRDEALTEFEVVLKSGGIL